MEAVPDTQLPAADRRDWRGRVLLGGLIVLAVLVAVGVWYLATRGATAEDQRDAEVVQKLDIASQVSQACATGQLPSGDRLCATAAQAQAAPIPGEAGPSGRGITGTRMTEDGRLVVSYTDGTSDDVGVVKGAPGAPASPARGITGSTIEAGQLVISYTDGTRSTLGPVVGSDGRDGRDGNKGDTGDAGRGVASVGQVDGRLVVTYTDGATQDVGPLPAGPRGDPAPTVTRQTFTFEDGSSRVCDRDGGTDETPNYRCSAKQPAANEPLPILGGDR